MTSSHDQNTETPDSPKMAGSHRRLVRPHGGLSTFHNALSITLVLVALAMFIAILYWMR